MLDITFSLSEEEQYLVSDVLNRLLISLRIPERGDPSALSPELALESRSSFYTNLMAGPRESGRVREVHSVSENDVYVSVETWREVFINIFLTSYPDIDPYERIVLFKCFTELLVALGVPDRAPAFYPESVLEAYREGPDAPWLQQ